MGRIVFFGTPDLAAQQLQALLRSKHDVVLVVAQPDRPSGRGQKLQPPPTKVLALEAGVPVLQPSTLKKGTDDGDAFFAELSRLDLDLGVVAAYGRILPQRILDVPRREMVNVHASLLPRWRGAAPIQRCIEAGDEKTGVCLMHMLKELDAGDVYARAELTISPFDDGETLTERVAALGAALLATHLDALIDGSLAREPQPSAGVTYAHMLTKEEGRINWHRPARDVCNHARAMHPWPGASTTLHGDVLKLYRPRRLDRTGTPGFVLDISDGLVVGCESGSVAFDEAQLPGKKRLPISALVNGRVLAINDKLGDDGA
jgi:methionyl-tRNA formyltransferase